MGSTFCKLIVLECGRQPCLQRLFFSTSFLLSFYWKTHFPLCAQSPASRQTCRPHSHALDVYSFVILYYKLLAVYCHLNIPPGVGTNRNRDKRFRSRLTTRTEAEKVAKHTSPRCWRRGELGVFSGHSMSGQPAPKPCVTLVCCGLFQYLGGSNTWGGRNDTS